MTEIMHCNADTTAAAGAAEKSREPAGVVALGSSAGGHTALSRILSRLPKNYALPLLIAQHLHSEDGGGFAESLNHACSLTVVTPCDKQAVEPGHVYVAPANYHMLIERDGCIALSTDERVNWSRPSIDVLFESVARVLGGRAVAVLLTGANADGACGMLAVRLAGGGTIAQDPETAESPTMPKAAIDIGAAQEVLSPDRIAERLLRLGKARVDQRSSLPRHSGKDDR